MAYTTGDHQSRDPVTAKDILPKKRLNACTPNPCSTTAIYEQDLNSQCSRRTHVVREEAKAYC
jgi:hypothetical protein